MDIKKVAVASTFAVALSIADAFVAPEEGISLDPYKDVVGVWTVCRGHTGSVDRNRRYTEEECAKLFRSDLTDALYGVVRRVNRELPPTMLAAMTSFVFNVGEPKFAKSTMLTMINNGNLIGACKQLLRWKFAGGQDCSVRSNGCYGVWLRRQKENQLCESGL